MKINGADPRLPPPRSSGRPSQAATSPSGSWPSRSSTRRQADALDFDVLDPTKLIPEEIVPLQLVGKMVLDRNPDNFFAETEQVAFRPGHVVPGIDFIERSAAAGPAVLVPGHAAQPPGRRRTSTSSRSTAPKCPFAQLPARRHMQMDVPKGRVNYEPNSLEPDGPREKPRPRASAARPRTRAGEKVRERVRDRSPITTARRGCSSARCRSTSRPHRRARSRSSSARWRRAADPRAHGRAPPSVDADAGRGRPRALGLRGEAARRRAGGARPRTCRPLPR